MRIRISSSLFCCLFVFLSACTLTDELTISPPPVPIEPVYDCTFYSKYNTETACNEATLATCTSAYQTFPNGGQVCWTPVDGGEICMDPGYTPPIWLYSAGTSWCRTGPPATAPNGSFPYYKLRNLIGCSSTLCICAGTPVLYDSNETCTIQASCDVPLPTIQCCPGMTCP